MAGAGLSRTWTGVLLISSGHLAVDFYGSILSPAMPAIANRMGLSLAMSGLAISIPSMFGAFMQPVTGLVMDALGSPMPLVYLAVAWSALFTSLIGIAPGFFLLVLAATLGSLSISAYHPLGAVAINQQTLQHRSLAMSVYSAAGTLGCALAPAVVFPLTSRYGSPVLVFLLVPGLLGAIGLLASRRRWQLGLDRLQQGQRPALAWQTLAHAYRSIWTLNLVGALRAWAHMSVVAYLAFYLPQRGFSPWATGAAISLHIVTGAVACIAVGLVADGLGIRRVFGSCLALAAFFTAGIALSGHWLPLWGSIILSGTVIHATFPLAIVISQDLLPAHQGLASGLSMGFSFGLGALLLPLTGWLGDRYGLEWTFLSSAAILLVSAALVPTIRHREEARPAGETIPAPSPRVGDPWKEEQL